MRWPGRTEAGRVCDDLVGLTDLLPTLMDGLGLDYPTDCQRPQGQSLLSVPGGGLASDRDGYVLDFGQGPTRWLSIRTRHYKYNLWAAGGREELYDLAADPDERHNLAPQLPALATQYRQRLVEWERLHGLGKHGLQAQPEPPAAAQVPPIYAMSEAEWANNLPDDERDGVESYAEAFTRAIARETTLSPEKLSLRQFKEAGGDLTGTPWESAWRRA
jgi:arylsulfatase A-like enzyme